MCPIQAPSTRRWSARSTSIPEPGADPFVSPGQTVSEGQTLLIIEAMKVMNQIRAPRSGRIGRVFVENATPVEFGEPLLVIE